MKDTCRYLGFGLGLRTEYQNEILENGTRVAKWFEAITENYLGMEGLGRGRIYKVLEKIRENYPVVFHGVSLSIGSVDPLNKKYLRSIKKLYADIQPEWVSDHLCWTTISGHNTHDLLPMPYTEEALKHLIKRVSQVQDFLGRKILLENPSTYAEFNHSTISEWDFISELVKGADCGILLDINNVYVSCFNHGLDPEVYLNAIPFDRVGQIHLAGHTNKGKYLIDTHDHHVVDTVWDLYARIVQKHRRISTMVEWDANFPKFSVVEAELEKAKYIYEAQKKYAA